MTEQRGFILVFTLLYLSVLTLLVTAAFNNSLLQGKMNQNVYHASSALQNAESALWLGEQSIQGQERQGQGKINENAVYSYQRRQQEACWIVYQVNAAGLFAKAKTNLESLYMIPVNTEECEDKKLKRHRMYWVEI